MRAADPPPLLPFDREAPCPACGIALEIRRVCRAAHPGLAVAGGRVDVRTMGSASAAVEHLDVACPGCGWSGWMEVASPPR